MYRHEYRTYFSLNAETGNNTVVGKLGGHKESKVDPC